MTSLPYARLLLSAALILWSCIGLRAANPVDKAVETPTPVAPRAEASRPKPIQKLKLLTIGNSFADNALAHLPALVKAAGKELVLFRCNLGGRSLAQHCSYMEAFEKNNDDPAGRAYKGKTHPVTGEKKDFSLREALEAEKWDVVTIQQFSAHSHRSETYQPFANKLIAYIKAHAPTAKIYIYETWAYRKDHPFFKDGKLSQQAMYEGLKAAYDKLSDETGLPIIPVGDAFKTVSDMPEWQYVAPAGEAMPTTARNSDSSLGTIPTTNAPTGDARPSQTSPPAPLAATNSPALPNPSSATNAPASAPGTAAPVRTVPLETLIKNGLYQHGSLMMKDRKHANQYGMFLAGCVWYETLYGDNVETNSYIPSGISPEDAKLLRRIAHETVVKELAQPVVPIK